MTPPKSVSLPFAISALSTLMWLGLPFPKANAEPEDHPDDGKPWQIVEFGGNGYVSIENIQKFYRFESRSVDDSGKVTLKHSTTRFEVVPSEPWFLINNIRVYRCLPLEVDDEGGLWVSTVDLAKLIDPILRPSRIKLGDRNFGKVSVSITKAEGLIAPIASLEPQEDSQVRIFLHFQPVDGPAALSSEVLRPAGTDGEGNVDKEVKKIPANDFDNLNIAIATACHSYLISGIQPIVDLGIRRSHHEDLVAAKVPTVRMTLSVPEDFDEWDEISETLVVAVRKFHMAIRGQ